MFENRGTLPWIVECGPLVRSMPQNKIDLFGLLILEQLSPWKQIYCALTGPITTPLYLTSKHPTFLDSSSLRNLLQDINSSSLTYPFPYIFQEAFRIEVGIHLPFRMFVVVIQRSPHFLIALRAKIMQIGTGCIFNTAISTFHWAVVLALVPEAGAVVAVTTGVLEWVHFRQRSNGC